MGKFKLRSGGSYVGEPPMLLGSTLDREEAVWKSVRPKSAINS